MISILIPTRNEELDLPDCISSVRWSDDIHVYDSHSDDRTVEIAESLGGNVTQRQSGTSRDLYGGNESEHKNWGLRNIRFKYPWVLTIDADERVTPDLRDALLQVVTAPGNYVAFKIQRRDFYMGTWLKHVQATPYYIRLFMPAHIHYERMINPVSLIDGPVGNVRGYLDHFPFSKGITHWLSRHNSYSTFEAKQIIANRKNGGQFSIKKALLASELTERRYHQKELFYRIPARPFVKFFLLYVFKLGFLDGYAGLTYAFLQTIYEYMIVLKVKELETSKSKQTQY